MSARGVWVGTAVGYKLIILQLPLNLSSNPCDLLAVFMEASLLFPYPVRFSFPLVRNFRESLECPFNLIFDHLLLWMFFLSKQFKVPHGLETVQTSSWILLVSIPAVTCLSRSCSVCPNICSSLTHSPDVNVGRLLSISPASFDFLRIRLLCLQSTQIPSWLLYSLLLH